jgi:hypothetical protein
MCFRRGCLGAWGEDDQRTTELLLPFFLNSCSALPRLKFKPLGDRSTQRAQASLSLWKGLPRVGVWHASW